MYPNDDKISSHTTRKKMSVGVLHVHLENFVQRIADVWSSVVSSHMEEKKKKRESERGS